MEGCGTPEGHFIMALLFWTWPIVLLYILLRYVYRVVVSQKEG
jgi:hypothetical protein